MNREEWDKSSTLPGDLCEQVKTGSEVVLKSCELDNEPADKAKEALKTLRTVISRGAQLLAQKAKAIEIATKGRGELIQALAQLRAEIEPLEYADAIASYLLPLKEVSKRAAEAEFCTTALHVTCLLPHC